MSNNRILILDYGSQYTQLIARRVRELKVYSEIHPCTWPLEQIEAFAPQGIILSGGPSSVLDPFAPPLDPELLRMGVPVLGICYGMQAISHFGGGSVEKATHREYGYAHVDMAEAHPLFAGIDEKPFQVWMSHGDRVKHLPPGFRVIASSDHCPCAAMSNKTNTLVGLQFHPEVTHTQQGKKIISNFIFDMCGCEATWTMSSFIETQIQLIRDKVGADNVILGLSGGVDSSVAAVLIHRAIGDQLT
ncbi:MAG: glutamine-hydrolyzing GMP synthase, partial [Deltaproteobacteria bacterium]|nr:glutamine-hydrolyzing GMP synthase [Deltaproteobacteria bacterium]